MSQHIQRSPFPVVRADATYESRINTLFAIFCKSNLSATQKYLAARDQMDEWDWSDMENDPVERVNKSAKPVLKAEPIAGGSGSKDEIVIGSKRPLGSGEDGADEKARRIEANRQAALAKKKAKQDQCIFEAMQWMW